MKIYVIGYKNIGEALLILFIDKKDNNVVFSIVVDCYEVDDFNITDKYLEKYGVKKLDLICWTHPHTDHSLGLDKIIKKYYDENMLIFLPELYFGKFSEDVLQKESAKTEEIHKNIVNSIKLKENIRYISANADLSCAYLIDIKGVEDTSIKYMNLYFLTPVSSLINYYALYGKSFSKPNNLSISFVMSLDGYNFYFGGDTENPHISYIPKEIIKQFRWIKVPHHCSLGARHIADHLGTNLDFSASTVFYSRKLPVKYIQELYKNSSRLFMTQKEQDQANSHYGVIEFIYLFSRDSIECQVNTYGNAHEY